jgi:hypothetical protein
LGLGAEISGYGHEKMKLAGKCHHSIGHILRKDASSPCPSQCFHIF